MLQSGPARTHTQCLPPKVLVEGDISFSVVVCMFFPCSRRLGDFSQDDELLGFTATRAGRRPALSIATTALRLP